MPTSPAEIEARSSTVITSLGDLAGVLRLIRETRKVSRSAVSKASGLDMQTVKDFEEGRRAGFKTATVERYVGALGLRVDVLLRETPPGAPGPATSQD